MSISRRALLSTGVASVVILGGTGGWLGTRTSQSAREPWRQATQGFGDPRLDALAFAILAPNPHNMQPWQVRLDGDDAFTVFADPSRLLPETDPPARQITIGFGAFLELFRQAAAARGMASIVEPFPDGEPFPTLDARPVARVRVRTDREITPDPLFDQTLVRHTQRQPFDTGRPVSAEQLDRILNEATEGVNVSASTATDSVERLRRLTSEAWVVEWENSTTRRETIDVTRFGKTEVSANPWGITLDGALMGALRAFGILSRESMDAPGKPAYDEGLRSYRNACDTAMAHIWSTTAANTRRDQLNAGATWVRLHQAAAREGLAFHPLSQALQEFPAMDSHYREAHGLLAPAGHTLQMLVRLGYGPVAGPAPREMLESKLLQL